MFTTLFYRGSISFNVLEKGGRTVVLSDNENVSEVGLKN